MKTVFAAADYWIALLNPRDQLHRRALAVSEDLAPLHIMTSEMVLTEVLNYMAMRGPELREASALMVETLQNDRRVTVLAQSNAWFQAALRLYRRRPDKQWSHTDCATILIMLKEEINEILSHDKHFTQAGLTPLLRL